MGCERFPHEIPAFSLPGRYVRHAPCVFLPWGGPFRAGFAQARREARYAFSRRRKATSDFRGPVHMSEPLKSQPARWPRVTPGL